MATAFDDIEDPPEPVEETPEELNAPEPSEDTDPDDDLEAVDEEGDEDEESEEPEEPEEPEESPEEKVLKKYGNDPRKLAKAYDHLNRSTSRQSNELGELRKQVEELSGRLNPTEQPEEKPSTGPNGFQLDEYGIETVPLEYWTHVYRQQVVDHFLSAGDSEEEAASKATIHTNAEMLKWNAQYQEKRSKASLEANIRRQAEAQENIEKQREAITRATDSLKQAATLLVPAGKEEGIVSAVRSKARQLIKKALDDGELDEYSASDPAIVDVTFRLAIGDLVLSGELGPLVSGNVISKGVPASSSARNGSLPQQSAARQTGEKPTVFEKKMADSLGISVKEVRQRLRQAKEEGLY